MVKLINYLHNNFYTEQQLLECSKISLNELTLWQEHQLMPACSYQLNLQLSCDSFISKHKGSQQYKFYNKGYVSWAALLKSGINQSELFNLFSTRYNNQVSLLKKRGFTCLEKKMNEGLPEHIIQEWQYFIDGVYGLCTQSGLPEDIATKELAIAIINELITNTHLNGQQKAHLAMTITLLDHASAAFAPHELPLSSREKYINQLRMKYNLYGWGLS
ncbi:DUF6058 family natural product biosynthesis protein [Colwelliaceae bacterium 6441]